MGLLLPPRQVLCQACRMLHARPLQVLRKEQGDGHTFQLDLEGLKSVFENPSVAERPACIISVAGAMRTGKSFLLDQMLRHLVPGLPASGQAPGGSGFPWRSGMDRDTSGIHLWAQPILVSRGGEELAVFLMDTQGTFDHRATVRENMTVFALGSMTSSVLVYNLMHAIREDHLQHLQLFTEYGRLALRQSGLTPFQKVEFLVRDWHYPHDASFGREGGQLVLERLMSKEKQPLEIRKLREHISSCFSQMSCCLLPHPGARVAEEPDFSGREEEMEPRFYKHLTEFVTSSLAPENLVPKTIAGKTVRSKEMVDYFQKYLEIFNGDEMPEPKSIFQTTAEVTNLHAVSSAREHYLAGMEELGLTASSPALEDRQLELGHQEVMARAVQLFTNQSKFGGQDFANHFHEVLVKDINVKFDFFTQLNDSKIENIFHRAKSLYLQQMSSHCEARPPLSPPHLASLHSQSCQAAVSLCQAPAPGGPPRPLSEPLLAQLLQELEMQLELYQAANAAKILVAVQGAREAALEQYSRDMEEVMVGPLHINTVKLEYEHRDAKRICLEGFTASENYGTDSVVTLLPSLEQGVEERFGFFREVNSSKRVGRRLVATAGQLGESRAWRQFLASRVQQGAVGGGVLLVVFCRALMGS